jgi:dihydroxyacetone kinase
VLNFGMAVEKARAAGAEVDMVVVGDDVGVGRERSGKVGRRGKLPSWQEVGIDAGRDRGDLLGLEGCWRSSGKGVSPPCKRGNLTPSPSASLEEVSNAARVVAQNIVSVGASLSHVHVPGRSDDIENEIADGEVEVGMGIHNEPGSERTTLDLDSLVNKMLAQLLDPADKDRNYLEIEKGAECVLLVNNLGGVSPLEFAALVDLACTQLESEYGLNPTRVIAGTFMTSLNVIGFSLSLLKVMDLGLGSGRTIIELLDDASEAIGWTSPIRTATWESKREAPPEIHLKETEELSPSNIKSTVIHIKLQTLTHGSFILPVPNCAIGGPAQAHQGRARDHKVRHRRRRWRLRCGVEARRGR